MALASYDPQSGGWYTPNINYTPVPNISTNQGPAYQSPTGQITTSYSGTAPSGTPLSNSSPAVLSTSTKKSSSGGSKPPADWAERHVNTDYDAWLANEQKNAAKEEARVRGEITSGWDAFINSLGGQTQFLDQSQQAQQGIVGSQYNTGVNNLDLQLQQGEQKLGQSEQSAMQNQNRNLKDIASNIRNAFMAGNVFLGGIGAGDSSAANQYSYALNKMGTRQRSDTMQGTAQILADVNARKEDLINTYNTNKNNLAQLRDQKINEIAMWFAEQQRVIQQALAEGKLNKSQDLAALSKDRLNRAIAEVNKVQDYIMNSERDLKQWAMGVSANINQLASNMAPISNTNYNLPQAQAISGTPSVMNGAPQSQTFFGDYGGQEEDKSLFSGRSFLG